MAGNDDDEVRPGIGSARIKNNLVLVHTAKQELCKRLYVEPGGILSVSW